MATTPSLSSDPSPPSIQQHLTDFFASYISKDVTLGRISNAHAVISDVSSMGVLDPLCKSLAEKFSVAVDFPKPGAMPEMIPSHLMPTRMFPDFMGRSPDRSYRSQKPIGVVTRLVKELSSISPCENSQEHPLFDPYFIALVVECGVATLERECAELYEEYCQRGFNICSLNTNCRMKWSYSPWKWQH